jgi:DNA-binding transcriptional MerR regulator
MSASEPTYPIRVAAEMTGVATSTLRAWERRYGQPRPGRTASGHRLYSPRDLDAIRRMRSRLEAGQPLEHAARDVGKEPDHPFGDPCAAHRRRMIRAIERFDAEELDGIYSGALALFPVERVSDQLLRPVIETLGARWRQRDAGIAEEHFFSAFLRNKIGARLHHARISRHGPLLVAACLPGERHELGLLLFGLAASGLGYRMLFLGADLPVDQAALAVQRGGADGLVLSTTRGPVDAPLLESLAPLPASLGVPVAIGGHAAVAAADALRAVDITPLGIDLQDGLDLLTTLLPPFGPRP